MKIYQLTFDYDYALSDIKESFNGADSFQLSADRPDMISSFNYEWVTKESEIIPDIVLIMSELLGCKSNLSDNIKKAIPSLILHPVKIDEMNYVLFSNISTISDCINMKKSKIARYSNGDIMEISCPVFLPKNYPILFKVKDISSPYFCTKEFKSLIERNSYTGLVFEECKVKSNSWF